MEEIGLETGNKFIYTETSKRNLKSIEISKKLCKPILIEGKSGSGKTETVREFSRIYNNADLVEIHLDAEMDSKVLLGSYICTENPGEFNWKVKI